MSSNHFLKNQMLSGYAASKGVPMPKLAVYTSGLLILFGGLGVLLGAYVQWALYAIILFLICVTLKMHAFWEIEDTNQKMIEMINFLKNMALAGSALMLLSIHSPWPYSLL